MYSRLSRGFPVIVALVAVLLLQPGTVATVYAGNFDDNPITASNAIVVDVDTGQVLFEQGMNEQVAPASLTKIFTTIVALETAALKSEMEVEPYDLVGEASIGLTAGETVTMETLLHGLMLTSGNDAAMTIARELGYLPGDSPQESVSRFVDRVNATAQRLGLKSTELKNPHGLDQNGHLSTAADIAAVTIYALDNPVFSRLISTPYYAFNGREFYNVNQFLDVYPGLIGGKTGITTKAGHSLMQVAERDDKTVLVVLLGSTREDWYRDAEYLLDLGFAELAGNPDDADRAVIGVAGITGLDVPELAMGTSVGGNFTIDRVSDHEAVIRPSAPVASDEGTSLRWAVIAIAMMGVALLLVLYHQAIIGLGALAFTHGSNVRFSLPSAPSLPSATRVFGRSRHRRHRHRHETEGWQPTATRDERQDSHLDLLRSTQRERSARSSKLLSGQDRREDQMNSGPYPQTVAESPARSRAENAIKLSMQGRYHVATEEFRLALERDPDVDFTRLPGFWRMQPMGYIAVAKAYSMHRRNDDARRLLTVVQLAFKQNEALFGLFGRAIKELED